MAFVSLIDLFKVGLGPSSSHTVGPMRAASLFVDELAHLGLARSCERVVADLYGSLALTGRGHGTDRAVPLGLEGHRADAIDPETADRRVRTIRTSGSLLVRGEAPIAFDEERDVQWHLRETLSRHANGMRLRAEARSGAVVA
jgi:L-serine dehydratase